MLSEEGKEYILSPRRFVLLESIIRLTDTGKKSTSRSEVTQNLYGNRNWEFFINSKGKKTSLDLIADINYLHSIRYIEDDKEEVVLTEKGIKAYKRFYEKNQPGTTQ